MEKISIDDMRMIQLDLLDKFDQICKENHLQYFLMYGTLIGAIRHKGFIPWDDDIDVIMPRKDYNKLCNLLQEKIIDQKYKLFTPESPNYIYSFSKFANINTILIEKWTITNILGVNIDIFPLDYIPNSKMLHKLLVKKLLILHYLLILTSRKIKKRKRLIVTILAGIVYYPLKIVGYNYWKKRLLNLIKTNCSQNSKYVGNISIDTYIKKEKYKQSWFESSVNVNFEGKKYPIPVGYEQILFKLYGDYMKLPPKSKRIKTHENQAYWRKKQY